MPRQLLSRFGSILSWFALYRAFQQKVFAIINQNPENQNKAFFGKTFFYQPGPKVEKTFLGPWGINSSQGFLRITMSRPGRFWDPILRLKSEFSGRFTAFWGRKVDFFGRASRAKKTFPPPSESTSQPETWEIGVHVRKKLFRLRPGIKKSFFLSINLPDFKKKIFSGKTFCWNAL